MESIHLVMMEKSSCQDQEEADTDDEQVLNSICFLKILSCKQMRFNDSNFYSGEYAGERKEKERKREL